MDCTICICELSESDQDVCQLEPCKHTFHSACIQTWLIENPTCPTCRSTVPTCNHGDIWKHPPGVIESVVPPLIQSYRQQLVEKDRIITELEDTIIAMRMQQEERSYYMIAANIDLVDLLQRTGRLQSSTIHEERTID